MFRQDAWSAVMTLHIDDPEADRLAEELAVVTGKPIDEAVTAALRAELAKQKEIARKLERIREISEHYQSLPLLDPRTPDEIIGYNEYGVPE
jgi:antitoxin VapB